MVGVLQRRPGAVSRGRRFQATAHLSKTDKAAFAVYAKTVGLDASSLLVVLLLRGHKVADEPGLLADRRYNVAAHGAKITAHTTSDDVAARIAEIVKRSGLTKSRFCGVVVRLELERRWLAGEMLQPTHVESRNKTV